MAAVICLLKTELASITRKSSNTSGRGLSRSCAIFSASATRSASPFDHDGVLRGIREDLGKFRHRAHRVHYFLKLLRAADIVQVDGFQHLLFVVAPLGGVVIGNEDGVPGESAFQYDLLSTEI